jgi:hypothetical protein
VSKGKDVYEHLAKVYLDSSYSKNKSRAAAKSIFKNKWFKFGIIGLGGICLAVILSAIISARQSIPNSQLALILEDSATRINYNFNQAKKESAIFDLGDKSLADYKSLSFRARKSNLRDNLHMRVELVNGFGERSLIYIRQIPLKWREFKLDLAEFENISSWLRMRQLLFTLEEWNTQAKKGAVYIDNVCFLK